MYCCVAGSFGFGSGLCFNACLFGCDLGWVLSFACLTGLCLWFCFRLVLVVFGGCALVVYWFGCYGLLMVYVACCAFGLV